MSRHLSAASKTKRWVSMDPGLVSHLAVRVPARLVLGTDWADRASDDGPSQSLTEAQASTARAEECRPADFMSPMRSSETIQIYMQNMVDVWMMRGLDMLHTCQGSTLISTSHTNNRTIVCASATQQLEAALF